MPDSGIEHLVWQKPDGRKQEMKKGPRQNAAGAATADSQPYSKRTSLIFPLSPWQGFDERILQR